VAECSSPGKHILTAAHCFDKRSWRGGNVDVRIGQDDIREDEWVGTQANIARVKIHERWVREGRRGTAKSGERYRDRDAGHAGHQR